MARQWATIPPARPVSSRTLLGVILFIAFWVLLAGLVFYLAGRGGPGDRHGMAQIRSYRISRGIGFVMAVLYIGFGVAIPLLLLNGNHANANAQIGGNRLTAEERAGRSIFAFRCGFCHELAASNSVGKVGPNLDTLKPPYQLIMSTIQNGCLQNPPSASSPQSCLGEGNMPAGVVGGQDARDVASFVARVAGRE